MLSLGTPTAVTAFSKKPPATIDEARLWQALDARSSQEDWGTLPTWRKAKLIVVNRALRHFEFEQISDNELGLDAEEKLFHLHFAIRLSSEWLEPSAFPEWIRKILADVVLRNMLERKDWEPPQPKQNDKSKRNSSRFTHADAAYTAARAWLAYMYCASLAPNRNDGKNTKVLLAVEDCLFPESDKRNTKEPVLAQKHVDRILKGTIPSVPGAYMRPLLDGEHYRTSFEASLPSYYVAFRVPLSELEQALRNQAIS